MNIQPSIDLKKVNLQTAVGYLISLHDNMYQWNLLGIKVVGVAATEEDIPEGTYEYGNAYEVGTEPPYDLYIYTRPDGAVHTEGYWLNTGKFPLPGPQGPKGDGIEQIIREASSTAQSVSYDSTSGATIEYTDKTLIYKDSTTGETKTQTYPAQLSLPILPGKYMSMDANSDNDALTVKVDEAALALDFFKIDKTAQATLSAPVYVPSSGTTTPMYVTFGVIPSSIASRDSKGDCSFHKLNFEYIGFKNGGSEIDYFSIYSNTVGSDYGIEKTPTDTGTLTNTQLVVLQHTSQSKNLRIVYDNQVYYRMDPQGAPDGTLNYIHLDSLQDGNGGYKLTAKCFSVTVSTRAWQVIDLSLSGYKFTHNLTIYDQVQDGYIYLSYVTSDEESYADRPQELIQSIENKNLPCTFKTTDSMFSAGTLTSDGTYLNLTYGSDQTSQMTNSQVTIEDYVS